MKWHATRLGLAMVLGMVLGGCATTGGNNGPITQTAPVKLDLVQEGDDQLDCDTLEAKFMEVELARDQLDVVANQNRDTMKSVDSMGKTAAKQAGNDAGSVMDMLSTFTDMAGSQNDAQNELNYKQATKRMERIDRLFTRKKCGDSLMPEEKERPKREKSADNDDDDSQVAKASNKGKGKSKGNQKGKSGGKKSGNKNSKKPKKSKKSEAEAS